MPGPLYARYIPPKTAVAASKASIEPSTRPAELIQPGGGASSPREKNKDKKDKKEKARRKEEREKKAQKKERRDQKEVSRSTEAERHTKLAERTRKQGEPEEKASRKRKRKHDDERETEQQDGEEAGHSQIHKSVLSKYERSMKRARNATTDGDRNVSTGEEHTKQAEEDQPQKEETAELHGLAPIPQLPQPAPAPYAPTFSALPPWLAHPTIVDSHTTTPFTSLPLPPRLTARLAAKGLTDAFAVQTAVLPLLLPGPDPYPGDVAVSATTGSGKTLAYMLPLVLGIARSKGAEAVPRLRGVVVVPTRELLGQARETAEMCTAGLGLRIGVAVGSKALRAEQEALVKRVWRWDPAGYRDLQDKFQKKVEEGLIGWWCAEGMAQGEDAALWEEAVSAPVDHVPVYESAVDVLICTPGRLVEHLRNTRGFALHDVEWLVVDEADRLLDESFQEWVSAVMTALEARPAKLSAVEELQARVWYPPPDRRVRKIVLSATMTRDLDKLSTLRLRRPKLVVVQGGAKDEEVDERNGENTAVESKEVFELPEGLREFAVPVGDGSEKPLFLLGLLKDRILTDLDLDARETSSNDGSSDEAPSDHDGQSSSSSPDRDPDDRSSESDTSLPPCASRTKAASTPIPNTTAPPIILVFVSSATAASRLTHLLAHLCPSLGPRIATLTKTTRDPQTRALLRRLRLDHPFPHPTIATKKKQRKAESRAAATPTLLVSTDLASRGLDLPGLTHVINYDVPASLTAYLHRAGRTARAGRAGEVWTLFVSREGRWFWREVARAPMIRRGGGGAGDEDEDERKVKRVTVGLEGAFGGEEGVQRMRGRYEEGLGELKRVVEGGK